MDWPSLMSCETAQQVALGSPLRERSGDNSKHQHLSQLTHSLIHLREIITIIITKMIITIITSAPQLADAPSNSNRVEY